MADRKLSELTELTVPATGDEFLVLDASEATDANKNKRIQFGTLCDHIPDGSVAAPSLGFASDTGDTGFFRSAEDEIAISTNDTLNSKFTTTGFQVGDGTATAQLHTFKSTTGDDVIIENTEAGASEGPNVVFYRNSASPAANDVLGTLEFRGEDDAGDAQSYAEITAGIVDPTNSSEDGRIDFNTTTAGSLSTVVRLQEGRIGINESAPVGPIHATNVDTQILRLECPNNDASSGADITLYRHRNDAVGQDGDEISTIFFRGHNDDATASQRQVEYASIQGQIVDATTDSEDGKILLSVQTAGTLTTQFEVGPAEVFIGSNVATDAGVISTVNFRGANDNSTPENINYSALVATVVDNADGAEDGRIQVQTISGGTLATRLDVNENKIGFFGATAAVQSTHVADLSATATTGTLPTANGTMTIADAASPTNAELLEYCRELEAKVNSLLAFASAHGLMASS
jgi:hypothetical protein|tara:strand:+ start:1194 stop:2579 length:1386 start_codon:yes stop_codon:yes gene_type:complete